MKQKRYRVLVEAEVLADSADDATAFVESAFGDVDPEPGRVMVISTTDSVEIDVEDWVAKAAKNPDAR